MGDETTVNEASTDEEVSAALAVVLGEVRHRKLPYPSWCANCDFTGCEECGNRGYTLVKP